MSDCNFDVGDRVQVAPGKCGTVVAKVPLGDGCVLHIDVGAPNPLILNCDSVTACVDDGSE